MEWKDVTDSFSEEQRHYKNTYLEQDEVYNEELEVSIFSAIDEKYEIYFSYGRFYGIVYADESEAYAVRDQMKEELRRAYDEMKEPTDEYINWFAKKYHVSFPPDILFDFDLEAICRELDELGGIF